MSQNDVRELIVLRLHDRAGVCNHCGKKKCAGKSSNSRLPNRIAAEDVLWAINLNDAYGRSLEGDSRG